MSGKLGPAADFIASASEERITELTTILLTLLTYYRLLYRTKLDGGDVWLVELDVRKVVTELRNHLRVWKQTPDRTTT